MRHLQTSWLLCCSVPSRFQSILPLIQDLRIWAIRNTVSTGSMMFASLQSDRFCSHAMSSIAEKAFLRYGRICFSEFFSEDGPFIQMAFARIERFYARHLWRPRSNHLLSVTYRASIPCRIPINPFAQGVRHLICCSIGICLSELNVCVP